MLLALLLWSPIGFFLFRSIQADYRYAKQANLEMDQDFIDTLKTFQIASHEVVTETIRRSTGPKNPCDVYRILFDDTGRYFLYMYHGGYPGILKQLSKERALLAARTKGQVRL
ncbi:hypothetical protein ASF84_05400 [Pseudomonas sp. Leaf127]|uniref:hypothetical protein n=1 Tax=Pseudomonas sp. Leaf127 TaxID=1736267 RepID=UPI0007029105|nr:hypothetical protein [Pseudomonas sp. Leaf127]KQQ60142.1 hypothetical protein ASF84_05400 [Pseudomonas sp. Leaf127]